MRIGLVDLDTSHPSNWIPIIKDLGHEVVGVYDHGDVHPPGYAERFVHEHAGGEVFSSLKQMVERVDCAVIHGCNWDAHVQRARPFVDAGRSVLVDKPIAGNLCDLNQFRRWADAGIRIAGGSSLRLCYEIQRYRGRSIELHGTPHTVWCGCAVDEFNYGIHAYAMLAGLMADGDPGDSGGASVSSVRHLHRGPQRRIQVNWADGRAGFVLIGEAAEWIPFYATVVSEKCVDHFVAKNDLLYRALLEQAIAYLAGQTDQSPVPSESLVAPELWALAAKRSWEDNNREVFLGELTEDDRGYEGSVFAEFYRDQKYPEHP